MEKKRLTASKVILFTILFILTAVVMVPFLWSILLSFKTNNEIVNAPTALPAVFNFDNYVRALETLDLPSMYKNTIIIAVAAEFITLIITFMSSFAISRLVFRKERNRKALYYYFLFGLAVPIYILLFPVYRLNAAMGVLDTYLALILPYIAVAIAFNSLLFVGFLNDFPREVEEAAIIDGCGVIKLCAQIIVPIIKPIFATVIVFNVIYIWNEFPFAVTYITSPNMFTLSLSASMFKGQFSMDYSGMIAATVLIMIPQLIFYIFLQKYIISGMTEGAVKA